MSDTQTMLLAEILKELKKQTELLERNEKANRLSAWLMSEKKYWRLNQWFKQPSDYEPKEQKRNRQMLEHFERTGRHSFTLFEVLDSDFPSGKED